MSTKEQMPPIAVGQEIWLRRIIGSHGPCGAAEPFNVVAETKTLWRLQRPGDGCPIFSTKKDMSEWRQVPTDFARKWNWMRNNALGIIEAVEKLYSVFRSAENNLEHYDTLKQIANLTGYKDKENV